MTILLDGHTYKYEVEATAKLFFPAMRFAFVSDAQHADGDFLYTGITEADGQVILRIRTRIAGQMEAETEQYTPEQLPEGALREHAICDCLCRVLERQTGIAPKWGLMTGIRPVRFLTSRMLAGMPETEAVETLRRTYRVSEEKLGLAAETARLQLPMLRHLAPDVVSLYIAIPFCPSRCSYCSFVSHSIETPSARKRIPDYIRCLCEELVLLRKLTEDLQLTIDTIYIGGGTPTAISAEQLARVMRTVVENFHISTLREYTVEAGRADTITPEKLQVIRQYGCTRISINPQTLNDDVLQVIGRRHTAKQVLDAFRMARQAGFTNINMDLIAGLPTETPDSFRNSLDRVIALQPESVTVHTLTLKRSAALFAERSTQTGNPVSDMVAYCAQTLPAAGYRPYYLYRQKNTVENLENVGYAKPGAESLYNILIMDETQTILGAGCAASTKLIGRDGSITRIHNHKFPYEYIDRFDALMEKKQGIYDILGR